MEHFQAQLSTNETAQSALSLEDIRLKMRPCLNGFKGEDLEREKIEQSFDALMQHPEIHKILVTDATCGSEVGAKIRVQFFPLGGSTELNGKITKGISQLGKSIGFDQWGIAADCVDEYRYYWQ